MVEYTRARRARRVGAVVLVGFTLSVLAVLFGGVGAEGGMLNLAMLVGGIGVFLFGIGGVIAYAVARALPGVDASMFAVASVAPHALVIERQDGAPLRIDREDLVAGWLEPSGTVRLSIADDTELALLSRAADARAAGLALLDDLELSSRQRAARFTIGGVADQSALARTALGFVGLTSFLALVVAVCLSLASIGTSRLFTALLASWAIALALVIARLALRRVGKRELIVGTDGLRLRGFTERFVPLDAIERVEESPDGAWLYLATSKARRRERVFLAHDRDRDEADRRSFVTRIEEVRAAHHERTETLATLEPGGRDVDAWLAHLRGVVAREGDYRNARVEPAMLERVVEDGAAPPSRRIGAALALAALGDPAARSRVRVAAEASADDDLRAALELAADGEVEESLFTRVLRR